MLRNALLSLWLALAALPCAAQTLAVTFDDGLNPQTQSQARAWNDAILKTLRANGIRAMLFPSLRNVGDGSGRELVVEWSRQGHYVGNHTSRHRSLNSSRLQAVDFIADVQEAELAFSHLATWRRMLRFPYLKEGDTASKRNAVRDWMRANQYKAAHVSVDTSDWYYSSMLAKVPEARRDEFRGLYLDHLLSRANYYNDLARAAIGRQPHHVLLLHTNEINAKWLQSAIDHFRKAGWRFIDPIDAYADPMYSSEPAGLPAGESIVWALARDAGLAGLRYPAEDAIYEEPVVGRLLR